MAITSTSATASGSPSESAPPAQPHGPMNKFLAVIREAIDWLFGYDFFISYSWEDEKVSPYAVPLAQALTTRFKFRTCLDRTEYHAGMDLTQATKRRVRASKVLLLVLRPCAALGPWVLRELEEAIKAGRTVIPVDVGGTFASLPDDLLVRELLKDRLRVRDAHSDDQAEVPSANALAEIRNAFGFIRRDTIKLSVAFGLAALFAVIALLAFWQMREANQQRDVAVTQRGIADAGRLATESRIERDKRFDLSLLLANAATQASPTGAARSSLLAGIQSHPHLEAFLGRQSGGYTSVAFSSDGKTLTTADASGTVILWDVATRKPLRDLLRGREDVNTIDVSSDDKTLALAGRDGNVTLWDIPGRKPLGEPLRGHEGKVTSLAFSCDGKTLASAGEDKTVILWDVTTRKPLGEPLRGHKTWVESVAFSCDGKTLASQAWDGTVILWDVATHNGPGTPLPRHKSVVPQNRFVVHEGSVTTVAFSPDGKTLAAASWAHAVILLWDVTTRKPLGKPLSGHKTRVESVAFSRDGKILASADGGGTVILWDMETREPIGEPLGGHTRRVVSVAFSADDKTLASASWDGTVILWDVGTRTLGEALQKHEGRVNSVAFRPGGKTLASAHANGVVTLWDVALRKPLGEAFGDRTKSVTGVAFSPDGTTLASASKDTTVTLWKVDTRKAIGKPLLGHKEPVTTVAFSPDSKMLASASQDRTVILWDVASCERIGEPLADHKGEVYSVAFAPDGKILASASADGTVILWDVATRKPHGELRHKNAFLSNAFLLGVTFSPDGKTLASAAFTDDVILWDVATRKALGEPLHHRPSLAVAFSPDGKTLASGGGDNTILWDVVARKPLGEPLLGQKLGVGVRSVAFSSDGKTLASASDDNTVILWDVGLHSWQSRACAIANRNFTCEEWRNFMGERPYQKVCNDLPAPEPTCS